MIYCFKACNGACSACAQACDESCKCLGAICAPICKVLDRPLAGYVVLTAVLCLPATLCAALGVVDEEVAECTVAPLMMSCILNAVLGVVHTAFSIYLQRRLTFGLQSEDAQGMGGSPGEGPLTAKQLMSRAGHIVLYDIGFCLYVFLFFGSFFFSFYALSLPSTCRVETSLPTIASLLLILYGLGALAFAFCWWFAMCCDDCCSDFFGTKRRPVQQYQQNSGLARIIFGKGVPARGVPAQQHMYGGGAPVQAVPVPQAQHPPQQQYGQPYQQAPAQGTPPPTAAQAVGGIAQQAAAGGLSVAGRGLQAAGRWLGGGSKK